MEALILRSMNAGPRGPGPRRAIAPGAPSHRSPTERAQRMADAEDLSHAAPAATSALRYDAHGIQWFGYGEIIGKSTYPWGTRRRRCNVYDDVEGQRSAPRDHVQRHLQLRRRSAPSRPPTAPPGWPRCMTESRGSHRPGGPQRLAAPGAAADVTLHLVRVRPAAPDPHGGPALVRRPDAARRRHLAHGPRQHDEDQGGRSRTGRVATGTAFRVQAADRRGTLSRWTSEIRIWVP